MMFLLILKLKKLRLVRTLMILINMIMRKKVENGLLIPTFTLISVEELET